MTQALFALAFAAGAAVQASPAVVVVRPAAQADTPSRPLPAAWLPAALRGETAPPEDRTAHAGAACLTGLLVPGLGHASSGRYFFRGLAFTAAVAVSFLGAAAFLTQADAHPELQDALMAGGLSLMTAGEILWVWSGIDAYLVAAGPPATPPRRPRRLGVD